MRYLDVACRLLIGIVFAVAVVGKLVGRDAFPAFVRSLVQMKVVPDRVAGVAARASVVTELLIVVLLAVPLRWTAAVGFVLAAGLLLVFGGAIALSLRHGNRAPCRCFGASATPLGTRHLVRNGLLVMIALVGLAGTLASGGVELAGVLLAAGTGLVVGLIMTAYDDIAELLRPSR